MTNKNEYFKSNPTVDEMYFTSDGQAFYDANHANAHAQRLKNKHVECVTREELEEGEADFKEKLFAIDFTADEKTFDQKELATLKKELGIETADNKKATLIAALAAEKERLISENKE